MADRADDADVIVVGGGGAGLAAAIEARDRGARVILLEKNAALGGSTAWSVGSISATRTPHQHRAGIADNADDHFEDLELLAGSRANRDNRALRRVLVDRTTEMFNWLEHSGLVFFGPSLEPPHRRPRMHNVLPSSKAFPYHLGRRARRAGVDVRLGSRVVQLLAEAGRVTGVAMEGGAELRARGGVVLAAGDYSGSAEMKAEYAGPEVGSLEPVNATATGDGFRLALPLGATVVNGDIVRGPVMRFVPPRRPNLLGRLPPWRALAQVTKWSLDHLPASALRPFVLSFITTALGPSPELFKQGAILVNAEGQRFTDEGDKPGLDVPKQPGRLAYIVLDARLAARFEAWPHFVSTAPGVAYAYLSDYRRNRADVYATGRNPAELARALGIDPATLAATLAEYNGPGRGGRGDAFPALTEGPFVALGPVRSYVVFTDGGLRVSERLEVLDGAGHPIPGLFAAGSNGQGGVLLEGHGHHLGWAFISGRLAGANAAAEAATSQENFLGRGPTRTPTPESATP